MSYTRTINAYTVCLIGLSTMKLTVFIKLTFSNTLRGEPTGSVSKTYPPSEAMKIKIIITNKKK